MTPAEFTRLAATTRLRGPARVLARLVLVGGLTPTQAARVEGRTHQEASRAARRVLAARETADRCPTCGRPVEG